MARLLLRGGTVINADRSFKADVIVSNGKIEAVLEITSGMTNTLLDGFDRVIDATKQYIIPGGIDPHTHMNMPFMGTRTIDDFESGTRAAVAGGTTMLIDFIIPKKKTSLLAAYDEWMGYAVDKCYCDFSFHCAVTWFDDSVKQEMQELVASKGLNSFKYFMAYKNVLQLEEDQMIRAFQHCKALGALPSVHAENGELIQFNREQLVKQGVLGVEGHPLSRDARCEGDAAERACTIASANHVQVPLMIVHNSAKEALQAIDRSKKDGNTVFAEATIAHLTLDESMYWNKDFRVASQHVLSPPLRSKEHQAALWLAVESGLISYVCTDHCSFNCEQRSIGQKDFGLIPNGMPGVEERLMLLWNEGVNTGRISMNRFVELTSTAAAKIYNVYPRKGAIQAGSDADIVVWDPDRVKVLTAAAHFHNNDFSAWEGKQVKGAVSITISRGEVVFEADKGVVGKVGAGQFVCRPAFAPIAFDQYWLKESSVTRFAAKYT